MEHLRHSHVGNTITFMLVTVQEAKRVAEASEDVQLVDGDGLKSQTVEDEGGDRGEVMSGVGTIGVVDQQRNDGVSNNPAVRMPLGHVGDFVLLGVNGHLLIQIDGVDAEEFVGPVEDGPLATVETAPGGLHRVLGVP